MIEKDSYQNITEIYRGSGFSPGFTDAVGTTNTDNTKNSASPLPTPPSSKPSNSQKTLVLYAIVPILVGLLKLILAGDYAFSGFLNSGVLVVGMYVGLALLALDVKWLYQYYLEENRGDGQDTGIASQIQTYPKYITRSAIFILSLLPLSIFMITSTDGSFGKGFLAGILVGLAVEMFSLRQQKSKFQERFLSQVKREFGGDQVEWLAIIFTSFTLIIITLVVI